MVIKAFRSKQFVVFIITGGVAALANFGSRFLFNEVVDFNLAVIFAYLVGMITAFILAKIFVFKETQHTTAKSFFWFTVVNVVAIAQTYLISVGLHSYYFPYINYQTYPAATAHAIGVMFPVFTSFIGHKYLSFKK